MGGGFAAQLAIAAPNLKAVAINYGALPTDKQAQGKPVDAKIYPDAGHAFENPNNKGGYKPEDAADAQARMKQFFAKELK